MALKKGEEVTLEIESPAFRGKGVAKVDGLAVFVYGTAPGDVVKARIIKKKKNYREAKLLEVLEPSKIGSLQNVSMQMYVADVAGSMFPMLNNLNIKDNK